MAVPDSGEPAPTDIEEPAVVDSRRVAAVRDTGLSAQADAGMDRFARLVTEVLGVPVALVSLIGSEQQLFPGMVGLGDPCGRRPGRRR